MKKIVLIFLCSWFGLPELYAQTTYNGVFRSASPYSNYHHFVRDGGGAAVYINQLNTAKPILRLSNGTTAANANVQFTVEGNGQVGIGTAEPTNGLLHIYKNATTGGFGSVNVANAGIRIQDSQSSMYLDGNSIYSNGILNIGTPSDKSIVFGTYDIERLRINSNGYIGIGSNSPGYLMHIKGNPIDDPSFGNRQILGYFEQSASSSNEAGIAIKGAKNGSASIVSYVDLDIYDSNESTPDFTMARVGAGKESPDGINGQLRFYTNSNNALTEQMRIAANGSVGIGTTNPDAKLTVKGDIHAERVKVDLNIPAPDYVFEEDYDLRSLEETASYIQAHKHLPEVPSAKELESSGVDLVEMNMLLLKKIEELTLHVIELKKEHEAQQVRIQKLENQ